MLKNVAFYIAFNWNVRYIVKSYPLCNLSQLHAFCKPCIWNVGNNFY